MSPPLSSGNPVAILCAMREEYEAYRHTESFVLKENVQNSPLSFFEASFADREVVFSVCGIGKVNAALHSALFLQAYAPSLLLNTGSAGALDPSLRIGDVVVATRAAYHDVDATAFGYEVGQLPDMERFFMADPRLVGHAKTLLQKRGGCRAGLIVSGDTFVHTPAGRKTILRYFPEALCVEMEGAAIAHVAQTFRTDFLILRGISDTADSTATVDFPSYLREASLRTALFAEEFLRTLS